MNVHIANLETDGEKVSFDHGQLSVVSVGTATLARAVFNPGWRWSTDVKPRAGTPSCQVAHTGVVLSGRFRIRMDDGTEVELGPGDAHVVPPGHDAWVVGDEQCVIVDVGVSPAGDTPEQVVQRYFEAFNRAAVDDLLETFTGDATVMADGTPTASGRDALRATYEPFFATFVVAEECVVERVEVGHDLALVRTHSSGTITSAAGGEPMPLALRELFALRRDGAQWRICEYVFNRGDGA